MKNIKEVNKAGKTTKKSKIQNNEEQKVFNERLEKCREIFNKTEYASLEDINEVFKDSRYYRRKAKYIKIPKYLLTKKPDVVKHIIDSKFLNNSIKKQYQINFLTLFHAEKKRNQIKEIENGLRDDFIVNKNLRREKMILSVPFYVVGLLLVIFGLIYAINRLVYLGLVLIILPTIMWAYTNIKTKKLMDKIREEKFPYLKYYNNKRYNVSVNLYYSALETGKKTKNKLLSKAA